MSHRINRQDRQGAIKKKAPTWRPRAPGGASARALAWSLALAGLGCGPSTPGAQAPAVARPAPSAPRSSADAAPPASADAATPTSADASAVTSADASAAEPALPPPPPPLALECPGAATGASEGPGATGPTGAEGRIDPGPIQRIVSDHARELTRCYERAVGTNPRSGRVTVRWVVGPDGRVARSEIVNDTLGINALERCLLAAICTWRFPAPGRGPVTVSYPFIFDGLGF